MKKYLLLIPVFIIAGIYACQSEKAEPKDVEGKRVLLKEKKLALVALKDEIKVLEEEIFLMDPPKDKAAVLVNAIEIFPKTFRRFVSLQGRVTTDDLVNVSSETGGRIMKTYVKEGSPVKRGQLLAKIDLETLQKQIDELETSLLLATTLYERQKRLWDQEIGSEIQFLQAKNNKEGLEKSLETIKSQLSKQNIYAPISGIIDQEFMKQGEMSAPGTPIYQILNTSKVKVEADVPESYLGTLNRGDVVTVTFPALMDTSTHRINAVGRTIDPANRTYEIEINISNTQNKFKPNLLAEVIFQDLEKEGAFVVPVDFVLEEVSGRKYVFIIEQADGKSLAKKTYVTLGESYDGDIIITDGLKEGDMIITEGSRSISPNDPVKLSNSNKDITNG